MPGSIIKKVREELNFSQKWVAKQMNISQSAYCDIENNVTDLKVIHLKKLNLIFNRDLWPLLNDDFNITKS